MANQCSELRNQFVGPRDEKPPWWRKTLFYTVCHIEHANVVRSGIVVDDCSDKNVLEWRKQAWNTLEDGMEAYMVELVAEFHM